MTIMARFVHVGFSFAGLPKILDLEPIFSDMGDWIRFSSTGWLIWTELELPDINAKLIECVDLSDSYIISGVENNQISAFAPRWVWNWIASKLPPNSFDVGDPPALKRLPTNLIGKK
jgi:hypothetical protein